MEPLRDELGDDLPPFGVAERGVGHQRRHIQQEPHALAVHGDLVGREPVELDDRQAQRVAEGEVGGKRSEVPTHLIEKAIEVAPGQVVLGAEVAEERAPADPRGFDDVVDGRLLESALEEQRDGDVAELAMGRGRCAAHARTLVHLRFPHWLFHSALSVISIGHDEGFAKDVSKHPGGASHGAHEDRT